MLLLFAQLFVQYCGGVGELPLIECWLSGGVMHWQIRVLEYSRLPSKSILMAVNAHCKPVKVFIPVIFSLCLGCQVTPVWRMLAHRKAGLLKSSTFYVGHGLGGIVQLCWISKRLLAEFCRSTCTLARGCTFSQGASFSHLSRVSRPLNFCWWRFTWRFHTEAGWCTLRKG